MDEDSIRREIELTELFEWLWLRNQGFPNRGVDVPDAGGDDRGEFAAVEAPLKVPELGFRP
jgi:hypothetical protein